jgi:putative ABC transport system permease protein
MNILHRLTRRMLAKNPTRTWVTIIGIMLSMALTVAVLEGAYSGLMFMLNTEGATDGFYQLYYYGLDKETAVRAATQDAVKDSTMWELVGWSDATGEGEHRRPLLCIDALGADPNGLLSVRLTEGRMPENDSELLLPMDWFAGDGLTSREMRKRAQAAIGQTLTLPVGKRADANGDALNEHDS